jgi:GNAT superfamily N-acetyltransferase
VCAFGAGPACGRSLFEALGGRRDLRMGIRIRTATASDAERVVRLYDEFAQYIHTLEMGADTDGNLTAEIYQRDGFGPNPAFFGLIAESDGKVIGYLLYHFGYDSELAARVMYIIDLYVSEKHRMRRAGASLMTHAQSICRKYNVIEIVWSVYKPNHAARKFYQRLGVKLIDDEDYMYLAVES